MIKNIHHYSMENIPSIFDEEALTALELVGKLAAKMHEVIENYNGLDVDIGDKLEEQDGRLDNMADEIATTKAELSEALETFIGTTMPAYVQKYVGDLLEAGAFNESMAEQLKDAAMLRESPDVLDADACEEIGYYFVSSGDGNWQNTPGPGGLLMNINSGDPNRHYQIFVDYQTAFMYVRRKENDVFSEWEMVNARDTLMQKFFEPGEVNLNDITDTGYYILGSSSTYTNAPEDATAGLLMVCKDSAGFQTYQIFVNYVNNSMYTRRAYNGSFNEWLKMGANEGGSDPVAPSETTASAMFEIERVSDTSFRVFRKGPRGYVCYTIARETNTSITQDVVRIQKITICDASKNILHTLSDVGHDVECVITDGPGNHLGGVHGYEKITSSYPLIFVDGAPFTMETLESGPCNTVEVYTKSGIKQGLATPIYKEKRILFANGIVELSHNLPPKTGLTDFAVTGIKTAMLSVNKECFTHWYCRGDGIAFTGGDHYANAKFSGLPVERADIGTTAAEVFVWGDEINEVVFTGSGVYARLKAAYRNGNADKMEFRVTDYGDRVKAYFSSHLDGTLVCPSVAESGSQNVARCVTEIEIVY